MNDMILILNYSNEFAMETAQRLRAEQVYCRVLGGATTAAQIREMSPKGIILSGAPTCESGVFDAGILDLDIPVLAMGHAAHILLAALGGASAGIALQDKKAMIRYEQSPLFRDIEEGERLISEALMLMLPPDVQMIASAAGCTIAFEQSEKRQYGVQFELERNDPDGTMLLKNFARDICGCSPWWTTQSAIDMAQELLDEAAKGSGRAVCAVSGGVDSTVAAILAHRAFGDRMTAIFVDTGLLREGECESAVRLFEELGIPLECVDRSDAVLGALAGKIGRKEKNSVVANCLYDEVARQSASIPDMAFFIRGMNYSDFLHSRYNDEDLYTLTVLDPLGMLFKAEVREVALALGLSQELAERKPFPALGLGDRIVGEVTAERLETLRTAERIFAAEITQVGLDRRLYKYFPVLMTGFLGADAELICLRAVTRTGGMLLPARLPYDLVERTAERICDTMPHVLRVFYDYTATPVERESFT